MRWQILNYDMALRSCFEIEFDYQWLKCMLSFTFLHLHLSHLSVVFLSLCFFSFLASSHSDWVIWAYESLKTAFCQDPNQLIFAHQHTCHELCVCALLALRWLLLSQPCSSPSSFSLCCFGGGKRGYSSSSCPSAPSIYCSISTTLEMGCFYGWWVKSITHHHFYRG